MIDSINEINNHLDQLPLKQLKQQFMNVPGILAVLLLTCRAYAAVVFTDNFNRPDSSIAGNGWTEVSTGAGNAEVADNQLRIVNGNAAGASYVSQDTTLFGGVYSPQLNLNASAVRWTFNIRSGRDDLSGFGASSYGIAFILGTTSSDFLDGSGYAVVWGQSGSIDPIRLVRYTQGLATGSEIADVIVGSGIPLGDLGTDHLSVRVTYNPVGDLWSLDARADGSSFADPLSGNIVALGLAADATYAADPLNYMGPFWKYNTALDQIASFDNITVEVVPEPGFYGMAGAAFLAVIAAARAVRLRRKITARLPD